MQNKKWEDLLERVSSNNRKIKNPISTINVGDKIVHEVVEVNDLAVITKDPIGILNIIFGDDKTYKVGDKIVYEVVEETNSKTSYGVNIISSDELTPTV